MLTADLALWLSQAPAAGQILIIELWRTESADNG
jgi:hypothetical protein